MAKTRFTTPVMRMLQGSVDEPQTKDQQGNLRTIKTGPNAGQPNPQYFLAAGIPKTDPAWIHGYESGGNRFPGLWPLMVDQAMTDFPNLFPHGPAGRDALIALGGPTNDMLAPRPCPAGPLNPQGAPMPLCMHREFAFKVIDGDGYDSEMKPHNRKEGFAGHWVVRFGSSYAPRCFHAGRYAANEQIQEKNAIRRGFYIRVSGSLEGNGNAQRPGLYANLDMIELAGIGPEIVSGPDAGAAFGGGPGALPSGATAMPAPTGGATAAPPPPPPAAAAPPPPPPVAVDPMAAARAAGWAPHPTAPGYHFLGQEVVADAEVAARFSTAAPPPPPSVPAAPATAPVTTASAATVAPVANAAPTPPASGSPAPYTGFMEPAAAPAAPAASPPPPAPTPPASPTASPTRVMLPAAGGATYESMLAAGWTDETLRANGMMQ